MSQNRYPSNTNRVVKEGEMGHVHSNNKENAKLRKIVMGAETQGGINVTTQMTSQRRAGGPNSGSDQRRKPKRNTEQRQPKITLDKFLVFLPKPIRNITQQQRQRAQQSSGKATVNPAEVQSTRPQPNLITPQSSKARRKQHPTIQLEYTQEPRKLNLRNSIVFTKGERPQVSGRDAGAAADDFFGHSMERIDNLSVFRCILQNPNGINTHPGNLDLELGLKTCYESCVAVIGLTETNVEWNHYKERENLQNIMKNYWDATSIKTSTSTQKFQGRYKPGGTMLAVCGGHWVARIVEKGDDPSGLGRFTYQGLQGKKPNKVMPILFYRLCQHHLETAGEKTAWKQQYRALEKLFPKEQIDPRRQGILDLQNFITIKQAAGYDIILLTDGNEDLSKPGSWCPIPVQDQPHVFCKEHDGSLLTLVKTCGLVDILAQRHPTSQFPATYARGRKRIDGIFVSPRLEQCVLRTGMSPFYSFFVGDHRLLFVDFAAAGLFGESTSKLVRPVGRGLKTSDPRTVTRYISNKIAQLEYHKIPEKLGILVRRSELGAWQQKHTDRYEQLDAHIAEIMRSSERKVARRYSTKYDWSPTLVQAVYTMRFWRLVIRQFNGSKIKQTTLINHQKLAHLPEGNLWQVTEDVAWLNYRDAVRNMYSLQRRHVELRQTYLEGLAEALVVKRFPGLGTDESSAFKSEQIEKQLKNLKNREDTRRMYQKIGKLLNPATGSVSRLDVPDDAELSDPLGRSYGDPKEPKTWQGQWRSITDPIELENWIIDTNIEQYNQAENSPFGSGPLADLFGPDGTSQFALEFLNGAPIPPHIYDALQPETRRILEVLQRPSSLHLPEIPPISPEQFARRYKLLDEKTSSSVLSGCHIGHLKASAEHPTLSWVHSVLMTLPHREGFSPARWRDVVDVIIPKEEGNYKQHRMRIIRLCESDFNHSLAEMLVHPVGKYFEQQGLYPSTQYGSREGQLAVSAVLNKVLSYDIVRLVKIVMTSVENNAIGCYDRIIQSIVAIYLLKLGFPLASISSICKTFRLTRHFIRTAFGLSESTYESTDEVPLFGAGQGTTGGPIFWLLIFCLMHEALDDEMEKIRFVSACASFLSERYGDVFVDDSNLGITSTMPYDPTLTLSENIAQQTLRIQEDTAKLAQHYEKLLFATGGALNIKKCHWNLITWIWVDGVARMATVAESPGQLKLTSGYNTVAEEVPRLEPTVGYRTLGVYIAPSGSMQKSLKIHREISERFAGLLAQSTLNKVESYFAFTSYFYPKIAYALPVTTYTQSECTRIQAPAMAAFLPKIGLNRHTARTIINGPATYGGLGLPDFWTEQGIGQLRLLLGHMLAGDQTSTLLLIAMSYLQLTVGAKTPFFNLPYSKYAKWIDRTWLTSVWQFLSVANLKLVVSKATSFREQREGDSFLMTTFVYAKFAAAELKQINRCRIFHQVLTVADIATADGQAIDPQYFLSQVNDGRVSTLKWPVQGPPSQKAWAVWYRALNYLQERGRLKQPLGKWLGPPYQTWKWKMCLSTYKLFRQLPDGGWESYTPVATSRTGTRADTKRRYFLDTGQPSPPPTGVLALATPLIHRDDGDLITAVWGEALAPIVQNVEEGQLEERSPELSEDDQEDSLAERFRYIFDQTADYFHRLIGPFEGPTDELLTLLATLIRNHTLLACSDGSFSRSERLGCHAWVFSTEDGIPLLQGAGPIDGHPLLLSPYRSELGGITAVLYILQMVVRATEIREGTATLYCDNEAAVEAVFTEHPRRGIYPLLAPDYDFIGIARAMYRRMPIEVKGVWVKGHFSGDNRRVEHDLNALVDTMAGHFRKNPPRGYKPKAQSLTHPLQTAALISGGAIVTSKMKQTIYANMFAPGLAATITKHAGWDASFFSTVDWESHEIVFRSFSRYKRIGVCKAIHSLWHTGSQKVLYGFDNDGLCPCCQQVTETVDHVYQCTDVAVAANRSKLLLHLEQQLQTRQIPLPVRSCLLQGLTWFCNSPGDPVPSPIPNTLGNINPHEVISRNAYHAQTTLGWAQGFRGRLSKAWSQAILFNLGGAKREERSALMVRWLIKRLLQFTLDVWEFRNGILHGFTIQDRKRKFTELLRRKVQESFDYYGQNTQIVSSRNQYLFERKTLEQRLQGDDDAILGWLATVEVAMATYEAEKEEAARRSARFFQPFREAGRNRWRQKQQENKRTESDALSVPSTDATEHIEVEQQQLRTEHSPSSKAREQLLNEVPAYLQHSLRRHEPEEVNLSDFFSDLEGTDNELPSPSTSDSDSSLLRPGPFPVTLLDMQFSSDSSYIPKRTRDLPWEPDSEETSGYSSVSYSGYLRSKATSTQADEDAPSEGTEQLWIDSDEYSV